MQPRPRLGKLHNTPAFSFLAAVEKQTNRLSNFTKRDHCVTSTSCRQANSTILTGFLRWRRTLSFILQANEERAEEGRRATSQRATSGRLLCSVGAFVSSTAASPSIPPHNRGQNVATVVLKWASAYLLRRQLQPNLTLPLPLPPRDRVCGRRRRQCRGACRGLLMEVIDALPVRGTSRAAPGSRL